MSDDEVIWTKKPHSRMIPGGILCTTQRFYQQGTGFLVEDITLEAGPIKLERNREREYPGV